MQDAADYSNGYGGHVEVELEHLSESRQLRTVHVDRKMGKPLGFTIKEDGGRLFVGRLVSGTACDSSHDEKLRVGDILAAVNGIQLNRMSLDEACNKLQNMSGTLEFTVESIVDSQQPEASTSANRLTLRALFDYNPSTDNVQPCKQLGLRFKTGDVIHAVNSADPQWWQGYLEHDDTRTIGIFPSPAYQKETAHLSFENRPFYELQNSLTPSAQLRRPLVLVGAPGVDRHELWFHLIESYPNRFAAPVVHTTRRRLPDEQPGLDYYFVDERRFQSLEAQHEFVETGSFEGGRYGTSAGSIQKVAEDGLVCVLTLQPETLPSLRYHNSRLMPYVVFLKLPDEMKQLNSRRRMDSAQEVQAQRYSNKQLSCMQALERKMLTSCRCWVDTVLESASPEETLRNLVELTERVHSQSQWVPACWLHSKPLQSGELVDTVF